MASFYHGLSEEEIAEIKNNDAFDMGFRKGRMDSGHGTDEERLMLSLDLAERRVPFVRNSGTFTTGVSNVASGTNFLGLVSGTQNIAIGDWRP